MEKDHRKNDKALSREAMWLSILGIGTAISFIGGSTSTM
jgi:hypothetical protein